jgi:hypothetical protein
MSEKNIGYLLLFFGIITIIYSGFNVYLVFTKRTKPFPLFNFKSITVNTNQVLIGSLPEEIKSKLEQNVSTSPTEIMPAEVINDTSNILAHLMLMGFLGGIGYKIGSIGAMLVRPVVVKLKAKEEVTANL